MPVETEAPTVVVDTFDPSKFVLSQTTMPIYELITPEVNLSYTQDLARSLFSMADVLPEELEDRFVVNSGNESFEVSTRDGSLWYADYDRLWNLAEGAELPSPAECADDAATWLTEKGILPEGAVLANIGSTNATLYDPLTEETQSKVIQYHVNYEFFVNDIPILGDAAQITLFVGDGGDRIGLDWKWRDLDPSIYARSNLIEYESVLDAYGISPADVANHRLAYTTDDDVDLLYPVYEIEILEEENEDGSGLLTLMVVDSTLFKPQVEITNPTGNLVIIPGETVTFDCSVTFGTPPFTYEWGSDFDGVLSTGKTFSTSTLSEVLKKDVNVPHAVWIKVRDAENRGASDVVSVLVEEADFSMDPQIILVAVGSVTLVIAALLVLRRRRGGFVLLFLLMLFSAFLFLPIATAGGTISEPRQLTPSAPTGAYDDGVKEVGIEWVGMTDPAPLWNTETNIEGFYNWMGTYGGYSREFNWGEYSAWEEDFKDESFSGTDTEWIDAVDFVYYQDHGNPNGISFTSNHDDTWCHPAHMRLGDGDLDSIAFDACSPLGWVNGAGEDVFERWAPTLQGIHQICSFATTSHNSATRGSKFAIYMTGFAPWMAPRTIVQAWFRACAETEGSDIQAAVLYASKSPDPYNPQLDDPIHDHAYGFGYVCSDPTPGTFSWYVYITSNC